MPTEGQDLQAYMAVEADELARRIVARKDQFGRRVVILGHHYQNDEVIRFADLTGDSLKLSQQAAVQTDAKFIVFCGVDFMAESAEVLSADGQTVLLPNPRAGCRMADMADAAAVETALAEIAALTAARVVPVTYVNSSAAAKAITARAGGACCTSSNVRNVFAWALAPADKGGAGGEKILAIPDEHLGRNTAVAMGYAPENCVVYDPHLPDGGLDEADLARATFVLWKGHCYVHQIFRADDVRRVRDTHDGITVIVHPECPREVVELADAAGSTEQIIRAVADAPPGGKWAIGTEANLVNRLARRHDDRFIRVLSDAPPVCTAMHSVTPAHLLRTLDHLAAGDPVGRVRVAPDVADDARTALKRMIDIKGAGEVTRVRKDGA